jgi:hypothetical protein
MARWRFGGNKLIWSQNPGCFERHLQRKYRNPLFPPDVPTVAQEQIDQARVKDSLEAEEVRQRFWSLLHRVRDRDASVPCGEALNVRKEFDNLLSRTAEIGGPLHEVVPKLFEMYEAVVHDILASLYDHNDLEKQLRVALAFSAERRRLFNNSFVAQLRRMDTPIRPDEVIPSLLSETPETIRLMVEVLSDHPEAVAALQDSASKLMANSPEARNILLGQPEKLAALGLDIRSAN